MSVDKKCYAVKHKNDSVRENSRSGGMFTAISDYILDNGGVVYGCVLTNDFTAEHVRATDKATRDRMRGSKYIPSKIGDCYKQCGDDLLSGKKVLFSSIPCQIEALNCYLATKKIRTENLIRVDILCFAIASPKGWKKFLDWRSDGKKIDVVNFRDKSKFGWASHMETITVDGQEYSSHIFASMFGKGYTAPLSCGECYFKSVERPSDITLGDYWGINNLDADFNDNKGVSLVLLNTEKGREIFEFCKDEFDYKEFPLCLSMQNAFEKSIRIPENREKFIRDLNNKSFSKIIDKYLTVKEIFVIRLGRKVLKLIKR